MSLAEDILKTGAGQDPTAPLFAITGAERPYIFDLPHVLSLPPGMEFRFRYRADWIDPRIHQELGRRNDAYRDHDLYILFHSKTTGRLLPLRACKVVKLEKLGPVYYLRFTVGPFADIPKSIARAQPLYPLPPQQPQELDGQRILSEVLRRLVTGDDGRLDDRLPNGCYLVQNDKIEKVLALGGNPAKADQHEETCEDWGKVVEAVATAEESELFGIPLLYLLGFQDSDGAWCKPKALGSMFDTYGPAGFELSTGSRYRMRVVAWRKDNPVHEQAEISCISSSELLRLEGSSGLLVGKYDVPEFAFFAASPGYGEVSMMTSTVPASAPPSVTPAPVQESSVPKVKAAVAQGSNASTTQPETVDAKPADAKPTQTLPREEWPRYYAARVPVKVKSPLLKRGGLFALACLGILLFILPKIPSVTTDSTIKAVCETLGLLLVVVGGGPFFARYAQAGGGIYRFPFFGGRSGTPGSSS